VAGLSHGLHLARIFSNLNPMKRQLIFGLICLFLLVLQAKGQHKGSGFGLKASLNYNTSGKYFKDAGSIWKDPGSWRGIRLELSINWRFTIFF
jgi:hypothetical protein